MSDDHKPIESIPAGLNLKLHFFEIPIQTVMRHYMKSAIPAEDTEIKNYEWFYDFLIRELSFLKCLPEKLITIAPQFK